jgi:hypothetical protein
MPASVCTDVAGLASIEPRSSDGRSPRASERMAGAARRLFPVIRTSSERLSAQPP